VTDPHESPEIAALRQEVTGLRVSLAVLEERSKAQSTALATMHKEISDKLAQCATKEQLRPVAWLLGAIGVPFLGALGLGLWRAIVGNGPVP
jgi:hypothetical protein